jgi:hypothetical protein
LVNVSTDVGGAAQLDCGVPGFDIRGSEGWTLRNWFDNYGEQKGDSTDWRADLSWTPSSGGFFSAFDVGVRMADRHAESINKFIGGAGDPPGNFFVDDYAGLACVSEPMAPDGPDYVMTSWVTPCSSFLLNNTSVIRDIFTGATDCKGLDPGSFFSIDEKTMAASGFSSTPPTSPATPRTSTLASANRSPACPSSRTTSSVSTRVALGRRAWPTIGATASSTPVRSRRPTISMSTRPPNSMGRFPLS